MRNQQILVTGFALFFALVFTDGISAQDLPQPQIQFNREQAEAMAKVNAVYNRWFKLESMSAPGGELELVANQKEAIDDVFKKLLEAAGRFQAELNRRRQEGPNGLDGLDYQAHITECQQLLEIAEAELLHHQKSIFREALFLELARRENGRHQVNLLPTDHKCPRCHLTGGYDTKAPVLVQQWLCNKLDLTADQKQDLDALKTDYEKEAKTVREKFEAELKALSERFNSQARDTFTAEQIKLLEELGAMTGG